MSFIEHSLNRAKQCCATIAYVLSCLTALHAASFSSIVGFTPELESAFFEEQQKLDPLNVLSDLNYCQNLLNFVKREGFYSAILTQEFYDASEGQWLPYPPKTSLDLASPPSIRLCIDLGPITCVERVWIRVMGRGLTSELSDELNRLAVDYRFGVASYKNYRAIQTQINETFIKNGYLNPVFKKKQLYVYPDAEMSSAKKADWIFTVDPGICSYFGKMNYVNAGVNLNCLEGLETFEAGQTFLAIKKDHFRRNLMQTGWFEDVRLLCLPDPDDSARQNVSVLCVPRTSRPFSFTCEWTHSELNLLFDTKFPILGGIGHQLEFSIGFKNLWDCWWQRSFWPNSALINYTLPRFRIPSLSGASRLDLVYQRSKTKRRLYCSEAWMGSMLPESTTALENFSQTQGIFNQTDGNLEIKFSLFYGDFILDPPKALSSAPLKSKNFFEPWWSFGLGRVPSTKKTEPPQENIFFHCLRTSDIKGLMFFSSDKKCTENKLLCGAWLSIGFGITPRLHLPWESSCPLEIKIRGQSLLLPHFEKNFYNVHPKFRCYSGGDTFLLGYDLDSVAPRYEDGSYGAKNGIDFSALIGKLPFKIMDFATTSSLFLCQSFLNLKPGPSWRQRADMSLGTFGVRLSIYLGAMGQLGIYVGSNLSHQLDVIGQGFFVRLRLE